jgi:hypothetical protein
MVDQGSAHDDHRPGRHQDGHRRGHHHRGPRRRPGAQQQVRRRALHERDEDAALELAKSLLSYLPSNNLETAPVLDERGRPHEEPLLELDTFIPDSNNAPYDMHTVIEAVLDDGDFLEVQALWAQSIVVGFGRVEGRSVGVVANNPMQFAGTLDIDASEKAARFVRTCDAFNVPVLTFCDVPGFLPGVGQEHAGIIRRGASCCTPTPRRPSRSSRSSPARPTAARTSSWAASTSARHQPGLADGAGRRRRARSAP